MLIRHADMNDVEAMAAIEAASYPPAEGASLESIRGRVAVFPRHFWLLEDGGELLGFVNGFCTDKPDLTDDMYDDPALHDEHGAWQMIFSVVTAPQHRGKGCAALLMRQMLADCRADGRRGVVLTCKERLLPFYAQFGFADEGVSGSTHGGVTWHQMRAIF